MLSRFYHRHIDRTLDRPVALPDRDVLSKGEWARYIGDLGEKLAAKHLQRSGAKILRRNFRAPGGGEVDIVSREGQTLVFTEVKARTTTGPTRPALAVDPHKQKLIAKGAVTWLRLLGRKDVPFRFDIIEVELRDAQAPSIEHLKDAFAMPKKRWANWSSI